MKCQNCGKRNAVVDYTQIIDGNKLHLHLCEKCASETRSSLGKKKKQKKETSVTSLTKLLFGTQT